ncbi:hypothetical protein I553_5975 [Mycobacterium xenopi 4042]|uniref:Uncharacterized protein n=1 Tax=Mycobacterium xenopi 4042 TaxID=1299334 RepID=X8BGC1_MYCXE|nr:hypothetical protein I553_5975 [Mycobacterium xenopi 4042]
MDALIAVLGAATNADVPTDNTAGQAGYAEREQKLNEAMTKFPANEEQSAAQLAAVGDPNQMLQMAQQVPQMASGIAQGMTGALSGVTQPLNQIPQQLSQVGQQAMQMGMGALQHGGGAAAAESVPAELLGVGGGLGGAGTDLAGAGGGGGQLAWEEPPRPRCSGRRPLLQLAPCRCPRRARLWRRRVHRNRPPRRAAGWGLCRWSLLAVCTVLAEQVRMKSPTPSGSLRRR